jgi:nicotinamidase-related amidase
MTTLANRPNIALLIVDVQRGVVAGSYQRDAVVGNIRTLVERARSQNVPVVWVQDTGENREQGGASPGKSSLNCRQPTTRRESRRSTATRSRRPTLSRCCRA